MSDDRKTVRERIRFACLGLDDLEDLDGGMSLGHLRDAVEKLITTHGEATILTLSTGCCDTCDSDLEELSIDFQIYRERPENDAELERRHKDDARRALALEADARRQYEKLRERFEPKPAPAAPEPAPPPVVSGELASGMRAAIVGGLTEAQHAEVCDALDAEVKP